MLAAATGIVMLVLAGVEGPTVAGEYYLGEGTGLNWTLDLNPDGTFDFTWDGCAGRYDEKSGVWCLVDGTIRLDVQVEKPDGMTASLPSSLRPITWGDRLYLVSEPELIEFCNDINTGEEPRSEAFGNRFLREDDWYLAAPGRPELPESARDLILDSPVRGAVVRMTDETGTIDRGRSSGLRPGMVLYLQKAFDLVSYRVVSVSESSSEVRVQFRGDRVVEGPVSTLLWDESLRASNRDRSNPSATAASQK